MEQLWANDGSQIASFVNAGSSLAYCQRDMKTLVEMSLYCLAWNCPGGGVFNTFLSPHDFEYGETSYQDK